MQYSLDGNDWIEYSTPIIMKQNGAIYVRLANGNISSTNYLTINISNIDKLPPNQFIPTATSTTNTITLKGSTQDEVSNEYASSGIKAYYFSKDNGVSWEGESTNTSYTFTGLIQGTQYSLKMKVVDNVGNETITETINKETEKVIGANTSNTKIVYNPTTITRGNVSVTITTTIPRYTIQYSENGTSWTNYTGPITMTKNGPIYAKIIDSSGQSTQDYLTGNITNIDKLPPSKFNPIAKSTTNSIILSGGTQDAPETSEYASSGIKAYYFSKDNGAKWEGGSLNTSYTFTGLSEGTTYRLKMKAVDNVGNEIITETLNQSTLVTIPEFTYTGNYEIVNDDDTPYTKGNKNWKIRFLTSGTLTMKSNVSIDAFLVAGGANGSAGDGNWGGGHAGGNGGAGGASVSRYSISLNSGKQYNITIGSSGNGTSSAFGINASGGRANGGQGLQAQDGGSGGDGVYEFDTTSGKRYGAGGGAGGGCYTTANSDNCYFRNGGSGGKDGGGSGGSHNGGGQVGNPGVANTGSGGGGGAADGYKAGGTGGTGIVIIRNDRNQQSFESIPSFSYTGNYIIVNDDDSRYTTENKNWKIRFLTSGVLTMNSNVKIDAFLVAGGANGSAGDGNWGGGHAGGNGGAGGASASRYSISLNSGKQYNITIGSSGNGTSSAFGINASGGRANGGQGLQAQDGGSGGDGVYEFDTTSGKRYGAGGGAGGGCYTTANSDNCYFRSGGAGGRDGGGNGGSHIGGDGLPGSQGEDNTGSGGGGGAANGFEAGGIGGTGIVIIRNARK